MGATTLPKPDPSKCDLLRHFTCTNPATVTVEMKTGSKLKGSILIRSCGECARNATVARPRLYRIIEPR